MSFPEQKFNIPRLQGISGKNIEEHVKLYAGYVKHANLILEHVTELTRIDAKKFSYELSELQRRFAFEFNGIRNHEVYFGSFEGGRAPVTKDSPLYKMAEAQWGSFDGWLASFKEIAKTRGIGWAMLVYDPVSRQLLNNWVDEQHVGQLSGCRTVLALDMWEHAFVADYQPSGKGRYIDEFFENVNWEVIEKNLAEASAA